MALVPNLTVELDGDDIVMTDTTVYGAGGTGDETRNEMLVSFVLVRWIDGGVFFETLPAYDQATVESVTFPNAKDAYYRVIINLTPANAIDPVVSTEVDFLKMDVVGSVAVNVNKIVIGDDSVYGLDEPPKRENVRVTFKVENLKESGAESVDLPDYDPVETKGLTTDALPDGIYRTTICWTGILGDNVLTHTANSVIRESASQCEENMEAAFIRSSCCEEDAFIDLKTYLKVKYTNEKIDELVADNKLTDARCLLDTIQAICESENCKGC